MFLNGDEILGSRGGSGFTVEPDKEPERVAAWPGRTGRAYSCLLATLILTTEGAFALLDHFPQVVGIGGGGNDFQIRFQFLNHAR